MGMLAIAPTDTNIVWAGTGEPNSRNTIEPGAGVYKSTNGGGTWTFMGLRETQHIGRIQIDPRNANVVYVAALGPAWKAGGDRGLYKTTDGGATWKLIKAGANTKTGAIDVQIDPSNPDVVYLAMWERYRTPYSLNSGGVGSGLFKSTDAGATWTEIKGSGYPEGPKGRIGLAISRSNPQVVYALTEAASIEPGPVTFQRGPRGERSLSLDRRRQDVAAHEQHRHASILLFSSPRRSEESRSRLLLVDAAAGVERRRQDDHERRAERARRRPRHVDRSERSRALVPRERRRHLASRSTRAATSGTR